MLKVIVGLVASLIAAQSVLAQVPNGGGNGVPNSPSLGFTPSQVFNVTDYGARCNGSTNDNTAFNAALTAAANSSAYQNNSAVAITGPQGLSFQGCVINSLNFTQFNKGNSANPRPRVEFYGLTLLCTGALNVCIDATNADFVHIHDVSIRGDASPNTPEIGIQIGVSTNSASSAWHVFERVNINNEFSLAGIYNMGSENFACFACYVTNGHTANGPIGKLSTLSAGSGYTNGTYTNVPLTGGLGTGALATIVVAGGVVSALPTITYEGRDYAPSDVLSAAAASIGGTGSGFSVHVAAVTPYSVIEDGQNHWRIASSFTTITIPTETYTSFTVNRFFGGSIRSTGAGKSALWAANTEGLSFYQTYFYGGTATPSYCISLFDNGLGTTPGVAPGNFAMLIESANCEGGQAGSFFLTGANNTPVLNGFTYKAPLEPATATRPVFAEDGNITGVTINNLDLKLPWFSTTSGIIFKTPTLYTITGNAFAPTTTNWNTPSAFSGQLCTTTSCVNH